MTSKGTWIPNGITPYYEDDDVCIINGDCCEIVPLLEVDFLFDDPPYAPADAYWPNLLTEFLSCATRVVVTPGVTNSHRWTSQKQPLWTYAWLSASTSTAGAATMKIGWEPVLAWQYPVKPLGTDVLNYPMSKQKGTGDHPHPKPLKLMKKLISHWTKQDDIILDPHLGSGTTLRAAKDLGRRAIGIEINEHYCEIAAERMRQLSMQL